MSSVLDLTIADRSRSDPVGNGTVQKINFGLVVVGRCENLGVPVLFGGHNLPPLIEIWLTDLPKYGGSIFINPLNFLTVIKSNLYNYK